MEDVKCVTVAERAAKDFAADPLSIEDPTKVGNNGYRYTGRWDYGIGGGVDFYNLGHDRAVLPYGVSQMKDKETGEILSKEWTLVVGRKKIKRLADGSFQGASKDEENLFKTCDADDRKWEARVRIDYPSASVRLSVHGSTPEPGDTELPDVGLHAKLKQDPKTLEVTTTFATRKGDPMTFEQFERVSKNAEIAGFLSKPSAFVKSPNIFVQNRYDHIILLKSGSKPGEPSKKRYRTDMLNLGAENDDDYDFGNEQTIKNAKEVTEEETEAFFAPPQ